MAKRSRKPTSYLDIFSQYVNENEYAWWSSSDVPDDIPKAGPDWQATLVFGFQLDSSAFIDLNQEVHPEPGGIAYFMRTFRTIPGGNPPRKSDDAIYYPTVIGDVQRVYSSTSTDHHNEMMSSSGLNGLIHDWPIPQERRGTKDDLLAHCTGIHPMGPIRGLDE